MRRHDSLRAMWPPVRLVLIVFAVGVGLGGACRSSRSAGGTDGKAAVAGGAPVVILHAGERALPFTVEVAATEAQRERGLMYRNHLDPGTGMLFIFERDAPLTFWMKNTLIPLDMLFIDRDRRIVGIVENAAPETETPRRVEGLSRYVLEIVGGLSRRLGVLPGSRVDFVGLSLPSGG